MTALVTPFTRDGLEVDWEAYRRLIWRQIDAGVEWIVPVGTTGESPTLSYEEHKECIRVAVKECAGTDTRVLAGTGSNSLQEAIELSQFAEKVGADGVLVVTPYYNKPTQQGLYQHFSQLARSISIPVVLYNIPGRTCTQLSIETICRLAEEHSNIVAVKEATGKIENVVALQTYCPKIAVLSGEDPINYPILASGGKGVISVLSNILPRKVKEMVDSVLEGNYRRGKEISEELYPFTKILFIETNPIPVKYILAQMGLIEPVYRLPLTPPSKENQAKILQFLRERHYL